MVFELCVLCPWAATHPGVAQVPAAACQSLRHKNTCREVHISAWCGSVPESCDPTWSGAGAQQHNSCFAPSTGSAATTARDPSYRTVSPHNHSLHRSSLSQYPSPISRAQSLRYRTASPSAIAYTGLPRAQFPKLGPKPLASIPVLMFDNVLSLIPATGLRPPTTTA